MLVSKKGAIPGNSCEFVTFFWMASSHDPELKGWNGDLQLSGRSKGHGLNHHLVDILFQRAIFRFLGINSNKMDVVMDL